jgi:hypothetical protein
MTPEEIERFKNIKPSQPPDTFIRGFSRRRAAQREREGRMENITKKINPTVPETVATTPKLTLEALRHAWKAGRTPEQIAETYGRTVQSIKRQLTMLGLTKPVHQKATTARAQRVKSSGTDEITEPAPSTKDQRAQAAETVSKILSLPCVTTQLAAPGAPITIEPNALSVVLVVKL